MNLLLLLLFFSTSLNFVCFCFVFFFVMKCYAEGEGDLVPVREEAPEVATPEVETPTSPLKSMQVFLIIIDYIIYFDLL